MAYLQLLFVSAAIFLACQGTDGLCFKKLCQSNPSNALRKCDSQGCGHYKAKRGSRKHMGIDIKCSVGDTVYAPFPSRYMRRSRPYGPSNKNFHKAFNTGLRIQGTGAWKDYRAKIFYVSPVSGTFSAGDKIGTYKKLTYSGITQHVHITLYKKSGSRYAIVDPKSYVC